ncbi:hypothetical protein RND71_020098 [Anisodus tanguticus]|uniref:Glutaredoxin n=1 Tax=Anisodus tanguticus TaxID=243964 RepID=A0AAE1S225_9SOLA|nr:hypothetical protein RND71_020098 [Anisodus tanguticus]
MNSSSAAMRGGVSSSSAAMGGGSTSRESQAPGDQSNNNNVNMSRVAKLIAENAIVIVATRGCYMCLAVKCLLEALGVKPTLFDADEADKDTVLGELSMIDGGSDGGDPVELPAVYVGGMLLGGVEKVIETHIKGLLLPMLGQAGALWL